MADKVIDATGLRCPLPVLKARKALKEMPGGSVLELRATDRGAIKDFEAFCRTTGDTLDSLADDGTTLVFQIRKRS